MTQDEQYMGRALELACHGLGQVSPNPLVGCVIVHKDTIIGEGWHQKLGEAHAEVNAIRSVQNKALLKESTVYVTLEPCSHHGRTPPCADLLIKHQVKKVIVAVPDPNPLVRGQGIDKLEKAEIQVETGILKDQALEVNRRFFTYINKKRPYIILKWAQTRDGFIARSNYDSKWISGQESRLLVHQWRSEEDAIMIGTNTARYDNPRLNVREIQGQDPTRVVIDKHLQLPGGLHLFEGSQKTICYTLRKRKVDGLTEYIQLRNDGFLQLLLDDLEVREIQSLIVEGGSKLLNSFIDAGLWDEARVFVAPHTFGNGIPAPSLKNPMAEEIVKTDKLLYFRNDLNKTWPKN